MWRFSLVFPGLERQPCQGCDGDVAMLQILLVDESTGRALDQRAPQAALHAVNRKVQSYIVSEDRSHGHTQNAILLR